LLSTEILPTLNTFLNLEDFQKFIVANYHLVTHLNLVIPSLIAMKLDGVDSLNSLIGFINQDLELELKPDNHLIKKMVASITSFGV
jgi:hypothetical protein